MIEVSTAHSVPDNGLQQENLNQPSISVQFSLQIVAREGLGVRGDMTMQKTAVPQHASRPVQQPPDVEEYDDENIAHTPRSAVRFRPTQPQAAPQGPNTGPIEVPIGTHRVSGSTRVGLLVLLVACIAFLMSGIHSPMLSGNVVTIHIPLVWLVALIGIIVVVASFLKHR